MFSPKRYYLLSAIAIAAALSALMVSGAFKMSREKLTDFLFTAKNAPDNIVIVEIDDESIRTLGQWPWPRSLFGSLVDKLQAAKVIGIDVNFKERSRLGEADDLALAAVLKRSAIPVILSAELLPNGGLIQPASVFSESINAYTNIVISADGTARKINYSNQGRLNFAATVAQKYLGDGKISIPSQISRIFYGGPNRTYSHTKALDVLKNGFKTKVVKDKIVLLGATARDLQDYHQTAFNLTSGVEIQANAVSTLLEQRFFRESSFTNILLVILLSLYGAWLSHKIKNFLGLFAAIGVSLATYNITAFALFDRLILVDLFYPNLAFALGSITSLGIEYFATSKEKKFIQESFGRYLSPDVIRAILKNPATLSLGGKKENLTVLFSDIRSFTTISETMPPEKLTHFLNSYLGRMTDIILNSGGVIDKYIGDAIMSFWGAPLPKPDHALAGVLAAIKMVAELQKFNEEHTRHNDSYPAVNIGVGINSGEVTVGNMGSEKRFDYTVIGDNVNLASRLESLTKTYGVNILISEMTKQMLPVPSKAEEGENDATARKIITRELDRVLVKGKKHPVRIYEVVPQGKENGIVPILDIFDGGREHYYKGEWDKAIEKFETVLTANPQDGPSQTLRDRCEGLKHRQDFKWEGVFEYKEK